MVEDVEGWTMCQATDCFENVTWPTALCDEHKDCTESDEDVPKALPGCAVQWCSAAHLPGSNFCTRHEDEGYLKPCATMGCENAARDGSHLCYTHEMRQEIQHDSVSSVVGLTPREVWRAYAKAAMNAIPGSVYREAMGDPDATVALAAADIADKLVDYENSRFDEDEK